MRRLLISYCHEGMTRSRESVRPAHTMQEGESSACSRLLLDRPPNDIWRNVSHVLQDGLSVFANETAVILGRS